MGAKLLAIGGALLLGVSAATQVFAYQAMFLAGMTFPPGLGTPWYRLDLLAVYPLWAIGGWWQQWGQGARYAFVLPCVLGLVVTGLALYWGWPRAPHTDGEAHWATDTEWKQAGCLSKTGIVLGRLR